MEPSSDVGSNEPGRMIRRWLYTFDPERGVVRKIEQVNDDDGETRRELSVAEYAALAASFGLLAGPLVDPTLCGHDAGKLDQWLYSVDQASGSILNIEKVEPEGRRTELSFEEYANLAASLGLFAGPFASPFFGALTNAYYQGYVDGSAAAYG